MNILQVSTSDLAHGAGVAAYRLHKALRNESQNSQLLVSLKISEDDTVHTVKKASRNFATTLRYSAERSLEKIVNHYGPQSTFSTSSRGLLNSPYLQNADIVNFHNIHWDKNNFSIYSFPKVFKKKPIVWTMHDMWAFTGHCIYSYECDRWKIGCGSCPDLNSYVPLRIDTTGQLFQIKSRVFNEVELTIVTPSHWLKSLAEESPLLNKFEIKVIPYGIDVSIFRPIDREAAKKSIGLKLTCPTVLFSASSLEDTRKGYSYFEEAIISNQHHFKDFQIVVIGNGKVSHHLKKHFQILELGYIQNQAFLSIILSAVDVLVFPSLMDNFPNTIIESLACGTPVVGFNVGGVPEMIDHRYTGYVAKLRDAQDLANGIKYLTEDEERMYRIRENCLSKVLMHFSSQIQARNYINLYESISSNFSKDKFSS